MNRYPKRSSALVLAFVPTLCLATPLYSYQDLGDLSGGLGYSRAFGMNAQGEIVGESSFNYLASAETTAALGVDFSWSGIRGFVWSQGSISEVGLVNQLTGAGNTLQSPPAGPSAGDATWALEIRTHGSARAIDDSGNIYIEAGQRGVNVIVFLPNGILTSENSFAGPPAYAARTIETLKGVNAASANGMIGGFTDAGAATWTDQTGIRSLPEGASSSSFYWETGIPATVVNGINDAGIAVGVSKGLPVWWDTQGQLHELDTQPANNPSLCEGQTDCHVLTITRPGSGGGELTGINNLNAMIGVSPDGGFLWQDGQLIPLHDDGDAFQPTAINDRGEIVGSFSNGRLAIRLNDGTYLDLNTAVDGRDGWQFVEAAAINNAGQIAVNATRDGIMHAFLLTPVPEPAAVWMLMAGLSLVTLRIRGERRSL